MTKTPQTEVTISCSYFPFPEDSHYNPSTQQHGCLHSFLISYHVSTKPTSQRARRCPAVEYIL